MAKKKTDAMSLAIKNGDSSTLDLFMKSPENIKDFTNWQDKTSSLELDRARAFEKTPFELNADDFPEYDNIEISGDVAIASLPDFDSTELGHIEGIDKLFRIRTVRDPILRYHDDIPNDRVTYSNLFFPIYTIAGDSEMHFQTINAASQVDYLGRPVSSQDTVCDPRELKYLLRVKRNDDTEITISTLGPKVNGVHVEELSFADLLEAFANTILERGINPRYYRGNATKCTPTSPFKAGGKIPSRIESGGINVFGGGLTGLGGRNAFFGVSVSKDDHEKLNFSSTKVIEYVSTSPSGLKTSVEIYLDVISVLMLATTYHLPQLK